MRRAPHSRAVRDGYCLPQGELWVFGYGSLMWNPEFAHDHACAALLRGYHRAFCLYSPRHRGTRNKPGLVLGLNRGGCCRGIAYRVPAGKVAAVVNLLWDREMLSGAYVPRTLRVLAGNATVPALTFVANTQHELYAGDLAFDDTAQIIACCRGERGHNAEYLCNTVQHLEALGVRDAKLHELYRRVLELQSVRA